MNNHKDILDELYGMKKTKQKKLDFSSKETWNMLKSNLVKNEPNRQLKKD